MRTFRRTASKCLAPAVSFRSLAFGLAVVLWSVGPGAIQSAWGSSGLVLASRAQKDRQTQALTPVARTLTRCLKTGADGVLTFGVCVSEAPPVVQPPAPPVAAVTADGTAPVTRAPASNAVSAVSATPTTSTPQAPVFPAQLRKYRRDSVK